MSKTKMAIFASGSGTNFQAIADAVTEGRLEADIMCLICDRPGAKVIQRAERLGIQAHVVLPKSFENKGAYESKIYQILLEYRVEYLVLAGYMRLIGTTLLKPYERKIINIHPSLLPQFPGLHAIEAAWKEGVKETGVTIHFVDAGMDTGPIIAQQSLSIKENDTLENLEQRIHNIEHDLYPKMLNQIFKSERGAINE